MSELGKPKKSDQKIKKKQKINVKMPHVNKKPQVKRKFGSNKNLGLEWNGKTI